MPRLCANIGFLFAEMPFLDRFEAAARAGFTAVEFASPYEYAATELRDRLRSNGLAQVLINLLRNAVEAALTTRTGRSRVQVGWQVDAGNVVIGIEDNGPGIASLS